jgi:hypothetical protein
MLSRVVLYGTHAQDTELKGPVVVVTPVKEISGRLNVRSTQTLTGPTVLMCGRRTAQTIIMVVAVSETTVPTKILGEEVSASPTLKIPTPAHLAPRLAPLPCPRLTQLLGRLETPRLAQRLLQLLLQQSTQLLGPPLARLRSPLLRLLLLLQRAQRLGLHLVPFQPAITCASHPT